jgi:IMP cyclohydrolase
MGSAIPFDTDLLRNSTYPGRGIIIGQSPDQKHLIQVYWIMGRSDGSRNRTFVSEGECVRTRAFDESKLDNPSLVVYYPIRVIRGHHILTNGDQTDTIYDALENGGTFESALATRTFEPDPPILTPRISGIIDLDDGEASYKLAVLKTVALNEACGTRHFFNYETPILGIGHCITTYRDDGNPPPSFSGEPLVVELFDTLEQNADHYWKILDPDNKVSLLVKFLDPGSGASKIHIINKFEQQ